MVLVPSKPPSVSFPRLNTRADNSYTNMNITYLVVYNFTSPYTNVSYNQSIETFTQFDYALDSVADRLNFYYIPFLVVFGCMGNTLTIYVFFSSKLRLQSTSQYLSALAVSDNVFLMFLLPPWLNIDGWSGIFHYWGFCQLNVYFSYVSNLVSAWLVVAFTVERFVAVVYPLKRTILCSVSRARWIIMSIVITSLVCCTPVLLFSEPFNNDCSINIKYKYDAEIFNWIDTITTFTIPFGIIVFLNGWIMAAVFRIVRVRGQLLKAIPGGQNRLRARRRRPYPLYPNSQQRVTRMLLFVSSVFTILNLPAYSTRIYVYLYMDEIGESLNLPALQQIGYMLYNTSFGINFLLYCVSGENFRRALVQAVPWCAKRYNRVITWTASGNPVRPSSISTSNVSNAPLQFCRSSALSLFNNSVTAASVTPWRPLQNSKQDLFDITPRIHKFPYHQRTHNRVQPDIISMHTFTMDF